MTATIARSAATTTTTRALLRAVELVRERPYLSAITPEVFETAVRDHDASSIDCTGGPHCWITSKALEVLQLVGETTEGKD